MLINEDAEYQNNVERVHARQHEITQFSQRLFTENPDADEKEMHEIWKRAIMDEHNEHVEAGTEDESILNLILLPQFNKSISS